MLEEVARKEKKGTGGLGQASAALAQFPGAQYVEGRVAGDDAGHRITLATACSSLLGHPGASS